MKKDKDSIKSKNKQYIDNAEFLKAMIVWKKQIRESEDCGEKHPPVCTYIAECFIKIAEHLSYRPNFINYPFREDMVGDGIENCILYAHNFDPKKSKNPFSYFTQIIYYAFLRRIEKEKKCFYYMNMQPLFKTSDIAKSFGYIDHMGNRNKPKFTL